jgi:NADH dehydrogenase/NADH:ubiquinone oxidoreductase subunit G
MFGRMRKIRELRGYLFGEMMQRFGVTERPNFNHLDGMKLQTAAARCIHCGEVARCKTWMEQTTGTEGADAFCPNAGTFAALGARTPR